MGFKYRRRAGSGGRVDGEGRRSSVKGGEMGSNERVRYSSRETAWTPKLETERAAERSRANDAVRLDLKPDLRPRGSGELWGSGSKSIARASAFSVGESDKSG